MTEQDVDPLAVYNSIFEGADAFVYRCHNDEDYTMQYMQGNVKAICGYESRQIVNSKSTTFAGLMHPDDDERVVAAVDDAIARDASWNVLYRLKRSDGSIKWIREQGSAIKNAEGDVIYLQGLIVDAADEVAVRDEISEMIETKKAENREIHELMKKMLRAEKHLSILSINAGIEAARAGEAGRGFAVIALEIKSRVDENGEWAEEIADRMAS